jgi:hypothetical protein
MSVQAGTEQRVQRECDWCHEVNDKPHHQVVVPGDDGGLVVVSREMQCCADNGCPDGSCAQNLNGS